MKVQNKKYTYSDLVALKQEEQLNPESLWPDSKPQACSRTHTKRFHKADEEPKLLQSAILHIRREHEKQEADILSDIMSHQSSNFMLSRENTPVNPMAKKRAKHITKGSELFDIQSAGSRPNDEDDEFLGLILHPRYSGLSNLIYCEVVGREKKVNQNLMHSWKDCLLHEDKTEIYGATAPYSFSRIFPINELEKGFAQIYGSGKKRTLRVGEESLLFYHMEKYLQKCDADVTKIARKDYDILSDVLINAKLEQLQSLPLCMKQAELMWRVLATYWRYSGKLDLKNKTVEGALINGRSNFLDLRKESPIGSFMLEWSNLEEIK